MNRSKTASLLRRLSFTPFALILLCFFLPFFTFSACDNQKLFSATGYETAYGKEIPQLKMFQSPDTKPSPSPLTILVLLATVAGIAFSIFRIKASIKRIRLADLLLLFFGAAGFLLMLLHVFVIDFETRHKQIRVEYGVGFILTCLLFLLSALMQSAICFLQLTGRDNLQLESEIKSRAL